MSLTTFTSDSLGGVSDLRVLLSSAFTMRLASCESQTIETHASEI